MLDEMTMTEMALFSAVVMRDCQIHALMTLLETEVDPKTITAAKLVLETYDACYDDLPGRVAAALEDMGQRCEPGMPALPFETWAKAVDNARVEAVATVAVVFADEDDRSEAAVSGLLTRYYDTLTAELRAG
jgi:hypothetical protein